MRFVVDDAPWAQATVGSDALERGLDGLTDRINTAQERGERVGVVATLWELALVGDHTVFPLLYERENPRNLNHDVRQRLARALDSISAASIAPDSLPTLEAQLPEGNTIAPAVVFAANEGNHRPAIGVITPQCSERRGLMSATILGVQHSIYFVTDEPSHVGFFRWALIHENVDEDGFASLAPSAFPQLRFADKLWKGLRDLSRPFRDRRDDLIQHLSVFSDHGADCFALEKTLHIQQRFKSHGLDVSPETPETMKDAKCLTARQRDFMEVCVVFEWHSKIQPNLDRIHVHSGTKASDHKVIIGIIHQHLRLPGD